jgi:hypothetical protein
LPFHHPCAFGLDSTDKVRVSVAQDCASHSPDTNPQHCYNRKRMHVCKAVPERMRECSFSM